MKKITKIMIYMFLLQCLLLLSCENSEKNSSKKSPAPIFEDNFNDGLNMDEEGSTLKWIEKASISESTDPEDSSNSVLAFTFKGSSNMKEDSWSELRFELDQLYSELWIRYRLFIPENYFHRNAEGSDNNKGYIMLWSGEYNNRCNVLVATSWWPDAVGNTVSMGQWKTNTEVSRHYKEELYSGLAVDLPKDLGKWQDVVIQVKIADFDVTNNGVLKVWKNKELIQSFENIENYAKDGINNGIETGYILGYANSGFNEETILLLDDFIIGESASSVGFDE